MDQFLGYRVRAITTSNAKVRYSKQRGSHIDQSWNTKLNASVGHYVPHRPCDYYSIRLQQQQVTLEDFFLTVPSFCLMPLVVLKVSVGDSSRSRGERALVGLRMHSCTRSNTDDDNGHKGDHME